MMSAFGALQQQCVYGCQNLMCKANTYVLVCQPSISAFQSCSLPSFLNNAEFLPICIFALTVASMLCCSKARTLCCILP